VKSHSRRKLAWIKPHKLVYTTVAKQALASVNLNVHYPIIRSHLNKSKHLCQILNKCYWCKLLEAYTKKKIVKDTIRPWEIFQLIYLRKKYTKLAGFFDAAVSNAAARTNQSNITNHTGLTYLDFPTALSPRHITLTELSLVFLSLVSFSWFTTTSLAAIFIPSFAHTRHASRLCNLTLASFSNFVARQWISSCLRTPRILFTK